MSNNQTKFFRYKLKIKLPANLFFNRLSHTYIKHETRVTFVGDVTVVSNLRPSSYYCHQTDTNNLEFDEINHYAIMGNGKTKNLLRL